MTTSSEPPPVRQLTAPEVQSLVAGGAAFEFVDVRTPEERAIATIAGTRLLDQAYLDALLAMGPETPMVFHCHSGFRSQQAADFFRGKGFRNLANLQGGIDAWSVLVDPSVRRY